MTNFTSGFSGGTHVSNEALTLSSIEKAAPGLLQNSIDERIVRVRPMSTPIDQISRCASSRKAHAMTVEFYSVDTKQTETTTLSNYNGGIGTRKSDELYVHTLRTKDDSIFEASETVLVPGVTIPGSGEPLVLYVRERLKSSGIEVVALNGTENEDGIPSIPSIPAGSRLVRMGRAATELDVQTAQFSALPKKSGKATGI